MEHRASTHIRRSGNAGLTLIEVMLAVAVLVFTLSAVFSGLLSMSMLAGVNEEKALAVAAVSSLLEEVQAMDRASMLEYIPPEIALPGVESWVTAELVVPAVVEDGGLGGEEGVVPQVEMVGLPNAQVELRDIPTPAEVRVTINWYDSNGRFYQYKASTMVQ